MKNKLKIIATSILLFSIMIGGNCFAATTFLEPGGDATFDISTTNGFWSTNFSSTIATDFVHGSHIKSISCATAGSALRKTSVMTDAGSRLSLYLYINALSPTSNSHIIEITDSGRTVGLNVDVDGFGTLRLTSGPDIQIGTDGPNLVAGQWYRISLAYTITSTTVNRFELFVDGVSAISVTNATLQGAGIGYTDFNITNNNDADYRFSDIYIDNSSALTDTGNIWVTAKRPNANGTTNGFTTQIGSGGSGYGTGHSPQVNERPLSTTNGWSMVGAGSAVTEEYNIEGKSVGDIDISNATIVDWLGWVSTKALVGETVNVIINGSSVAQAITSTITLYTKIKGSATYPAGTGTDLGIITDTSLTTVSLYETGVIVAFIPNNTSTSIKTFNGLIYASTKTILGLVEASMKTFNGLQ